MQKRIVFSYLGALLIPICKGGIETMVYLIIGTIIALVGIGLMTVKYKLIGLIIMLIGGSFLLKGRRELDKLK